MNLEELKNYRKWIDRSPFEVHMHVLAVGGWKHVFDRGVPRWASRVRNYFNVSPQKLTRLDDDRSETLLKRAQTAIPAAACASAKKMHDMMGVNLGPKGCPAQTDAEAMMGVRDQVGTGGALSGDVYVDEFRQIWFQMDPGGAIYHFGEKRWWPTGSAIWTSLVTRQKMVPVFKLVSPDGTGGSRECCITNPQVVPFEMGGIVVKAGKSTIGAVNEVVNLPLNRHVRDSVQEGSYNYAETIEQGIHRHDRFDVNTDPMEPGFFVDPPERFSQLLFRRFPEKAPGETKPLADQVDYPSS